MSYKDRCRFSTRLLVALLGIGLCGLFAGCFARYIPPEGTYRIAAEKVIEGKDFVVYRLDVIFHGSRAVTLFGDGNARVAQIDPRQGKKLGHCEVLLVADRITVNNLPYLNWRVELRNGEYNAGGPTVLPLDRDRPLDQLLEFRLRPGDYPLGSEAEIAVLGGQSLKLTVE